MAETVDPLLQPHIVNLVRLKAGEYGYKLTEEEIKAVINSLLWLRRRFETWPKEQDAK